MPVLFNQLKKYKFGIVSAKEAIQREKIVFGGKSVEVLNSKVELARAMLWDNQKKKAKRLLSQI